MNRFLMIVCLLVFFDGVVYTQTPVLNNNRTGLKWQHIKTEDFKIVFPRGFESEAQRMANTLQFLHDPIDKSLGTNTRRATILLQNQNSVANGFVTLGPRRSEFYTSTPQDYNFLGTNDWLNTLAVHEYRHLVQFNKSRAGFNKLFYYLFGQNTQGAMASIAAPQWFWEGDAVATETAFTESGRGRIPAFSRIFRANLLEGKRYNYHKQSLRSYKDFVPNHYVLGYYMVSHIRKKTNNANVFSDVAQKTWSVPFIPFAFSNALKRSTGKYVVANYEDMMDELAEEWGSQLKKVKFNTFEKVTQRSDNSFTDYSCPSLMANGKLLILKSGIGDIAQFVMLGENGSEEVLYTPGMLNNSGMVSIAGNTVAWNEYMFDPRWKNHSYSVIKLYNQDTETLKTLTKKTRYHGVSLSPDTRQVATIESLEDGTYRLVILDANTGVVAKQYDNQTQGLLTLPAWSSDGKKITFLSNRSNKKSVQIIDLASGTETVLIPAGTENIGNPMIINEYLYYQSGYSGIDNIYVMNLASGKRYQVTSSRYGAYNFALSNDSKTVYYNDHSVNGLDVVCMPFDPSQWTPFDQIAQNNSGYYKTLEKQEQHSHILDSIPAKQYEIKKNSPLKGLINPHSWGPFLSSDDLNEVKIGVFSRDVLSTTSIYAGYNYNVDSQEGAIVGRVSYQGFYPILDFEYSQSNRSSSSGTTELTWNETTVQAGVRLPLLLTRSKYHQELILGNSVGITEVDNFKNSASQFSRFSPAFDSLSLFLRDEVQNGNLNFNKFELTYFRLMKRSTRDIKSMFGQTLTIEQYNTLGSSDLKGSLFAMRGNLYFPGFARHHSIYLTYGYQKLDNELRGDIYYFPNRIFRPRGYAFPSSDKFTTLRFNYALPIWYPDVAIGPVLNIKRVKTNFFYDYGKGIGKSYFFLTDSLGTSNQTLYFSNNSAVYNSFGMEITFDINVMRALPELEIGVRYVYTTANKIFEQADSKIEFIIGNISF